MMKIAYEKIQDRKIIGEFTNERNLKIASEVFEVLVRYTQHKIFKNHRERQAVDFNTFQLKKSCLKALLMHKISKAQSGNLTQCVRSNLRSAIFIRWFNYIHDFLPKKKIAEQNYKRSRFLAFVKYVESMKQIRIQRRKLHELHTDYGKARLI